jgi:hypothetical protein
MKLWEPPKVRAFWQPRSHDFNVFTERKHVEKLRYMHRNPVKRGLVTSPELWRWSSFRYYRFDDYVRHVVRRELCTSVIEQ